MASFWRILLAMINRHYSWSTQTAATNESLAGSIRCRVYVILGDLKFVLATPETIMIIGYVGR